MQGRRGGQRLESGTYLDVFVQHRLGECGASGQKGTQPE
jgi:hypothetical protein